MPRLSCCAMHVIWSKRTCLFGCSIVNFNFIHFRQTSDDAQDEHVESRGRGGQQSGRPVDVRDDSARRVDAEDGREERADASDRGRFRPLFEVVSYSAQCCLLLHVLKLFSVWMRTMFRLCMPVVTNNILRHRQSPNTT